VNSRYMYRAARSDGAMVNGVVAAASQAQAANLLSERGLFPVDVVEATDVQRPMAGRRDLAIVFRSISALVSAGVPVEQALAATEARTRGGLRETLGLARASLREGTNLAFALSAAGGVVPAVVIGMIRAGERGSQLATALEQVAAHLEQEAELLGRVQQALAYPLLLMVVGVASIALIATVIVPRFAELLGDFGQQLPAATRLLLAGSSILSRFWLPLVLLAIAFTWGSREWLRRPRGRLRAHEVLLSLPAVGAVRHTLATTRVTRAFGGMLRAGMPLLAALDGAREAAGDLAVAQRLHRVRQRVSEGAELAGSLAQEHALSPSAVQLIGVGESSGRLGEMALRAGDLSAQEAERGLRTLVSILEPGLILAFGAVVAFVAAALLQAVYSLRPGG